MTGFELVVDGISLAMTGWLKSYGFGGCFRKMRAAQFGTSSVRLSSEYACD